MKQYIYTPAECGLARWPQGELILDGVPVTHNAAEADVFVYPGAIHHLNGNDLRRLPYFSGNESRHAFFHCADHETLYGTSALIMRCNTRDWYLSQDPNTIAWPWPVEDYEDCAAVPESGFRYDVSFHGWRASPVRHRSVEAFRRSLLHCDLVEYSDFTGYLKADDPELARRRAEFRRSMRESRISLCPESIPGVLPYRFFEAMSAARVPFLVGNHYVLPFADEIPYSEFILTLKDAVQWSSWVERRDRGLLDQDETYNEAAAMASQFIKTHTDAQLIEMGQKARHYWLKYLDSRNWRSLMAYAVEKRVGVAA